MVSERSKQINSSGIRRVFDLAAKLKDPINLSIGLPDFDAHPATREAAKRAIDTKRNSYTVTQGIPELREKLKVQLGITENMGLDLFISSGVSGGLFLTYLSILDPGDEVLVPDPFFGMYRDQALLINAVPTFYNTYPRFSVSAEAIERGITNKTKAIVVNSPNNPTGYAVTQNELDDIVALAKKYDLWLIYDEIYSAFCYDYPHATCLGRYEKTIILNGFSKSHGIPGWRMGYVIAPHEVVAAMLKIQQYSFVCAPSVAQWGMLEGLDIDLTALGAEYRKKRDFISHALKDRFTFAPSGGAYYLFPEAPGGSGQAFVERCIASGLLVVPGNVFSSRDSHFRISYSAPMEKLEKGAEILNRLAG